MKIYAVYDTNILVSAMISRRTDSAVVLVMEALLSGEVVPLYNDEIIREYNEVLHRGQFHFPEDLVSGIISHIQKTGISSARIHSNEEFPDLDDIVFYEVTLSKEDAYLVTGNIKHFPKKPFVVTPAEMIAILEGKDK